MNLPALTADRVYALTQQRFRRAVASLSATERQLYQLRFYQEMPLRQIAALHGLSPAAVKGRLRRIQRQLEQAEFLPG